MERRSADDPSSTVVSPAPSVAERQLADDGTNRSEVLLDRPSVGLHLEPMTWGIQYRYTPDARLMVLASHPYDNEDYIRSYDEFLQLSRDAAAG